MSFHEDYEELQRLEVTPENITDYSEIALSKILELTDKVVRNYLQLGSNSELKGSGLEDAAFGASGLPNLVDILDDQQIRIDRINRAGDFIARRVVAIDEIIVPPDQGQFNKGDRNTPYEAPGQKSRLQTILFIAQSLGVDLDKIQIETGVVSDEMMRKSSYATVQVTPLDRIVQVCDEEGNATYVFIGSRLAKLGITTQGLNRSTKLQKSELIKEHLKNPVGARFVYGKNWAERIKESLIKDFEPPFTEEDYPFMLKDSEIPDCIKERGNEWHGYFIDEDGGHWSTEARVAKRLGISVGIVTQWDVTKGIISLKTVRGLNGQRAAFFKIEELAQLDSVRKLRASKGIDPDQV